MLASHPRAFERSPMLDVFKMSDVYKLGNNTHRSIEVKGMILKGPKLLDQ